MSLDLAELGLTQEELRDRVTDRMCDRLMLTKGTDEDGEPLCRSSEFKKELEKWIATQITQAVAALAEKHVLPTIAERIENLCLQATNRWGEETGGRLTFTEYLVAQADAYLKEQVDFEGKTRESSSFRSSWKGTQTRITYLVHRHLHYSIEGAMKAAMESANSSIVGGIEAAVKMKLAEVQQALKINVVTK